MVSMSDDPSSIPPTTARCFLQRHFLRDPTPHPSLTLTQLRETSFHTHGLPLIRTSHNMAMPWSYKLVAVKQGLTMPISGSPVAIDIGGIVNIAAAHSTIDNVRGLAGSPILHLMSSWCIGGSCGPSARALHLG